MSHADFINNLTYYLNKITLSNIKFLYFHANDLTSPKLREIFRRFEVNNKPYYILQGFQHNYWYIYTESTIKYLVDVVSSGPVFSEVNILKSGTLYNVNHGDHIDFGIIKLKTNDVVVKTHKTIYTDIGDFTFDRSAQECNFLLRNTDLTNVSTFVKTKCVKPDNTICGSISDTYNDDDMSVIYHLLQVMTGTKKDESNKKQKGGNIWQDEFLSYLQEYVINPIKDQVNIADIIVISNEKKKTGSIAVIINLIDYTSFIIRLNKKDYQKDEYMGKLKSDIVSLCEKLENLQVK